MTPMQRQKLDRAETEAVLMGHMQEMVEAMKQHDAMADYLSMTIISGDGSNFTLDVHNRYWDKQEGRFAIRKRASYFYESGGEQ
jgi:hypothetical protein